jgi:hypothetical protein
MVSSGSFPQLLLGELEFDSEFELLAGAPHHHFLQTLSEPEPLVSQPLPLSLPGFHCPNLVSVVVRLHSMMHQIPSQFGPVAFDSTLPSIFVFVSLWQSWHLSSNMFLAVRPEPGHPDHPRRRVAQNRWVHCSASGIRQASS